MITETEEQKEAVEKIDGPVCLKAGAGTGKTSVLVRRYMKILSNLVGRGISISDALESILTVTFTRKASMEMVGRLEDELKMLFRDYDTGILVKKAYISTIDSFCTRFLRENSLEIGIEPNFRILDEGEAKIIFRNKGREALNQGKLPAIVLDRWVEDFLRDVYQYIMSLKSKAISPDDFLRKIIKMKEGEKKNLARIIGKIYVFYEEELARKNLFDFSGILLKTLQVLKENEGIRKRYQKQFKYVLVDEYQDTTSIQDELLYELSLPEGNYFVVGDAKQSIYGFRDAEPGNIQNFTKGERTIKLCLTCNFRSENKILELVNKALENEMEDYEPVSSEKYNGKCCNEVFLCESQEEEAEFIAKRINQLLDDGYDFKDIAILLRGVRTPVSIYEGALRKYNVPFITTGGSGYYDRPEIKDLMALLSAINNPFDDMSLVRLLRSPIFRVKNSTLTQLAWIYPEDESDDEEKVGKKRYSLYDALGKVQDLEIGKEEKLLLTRAKDFLDRFFLAKGNYSLVQLVYTAISQSNYIHYTQSLPFAEGKRSIANIKKFYSLIQEFDQRNIFSTLEDFIAYVKEVTQQGVVESEARMSEENAVRVMSVHQAKGLEFKIVFVANIKDRAFPYQGGNSSDYVFDEDEIIVDKKNPQEKKKSDSEELKLFYVAMTRAKDKLVLSGSKGKNGKISKFLSYFIDGDRNLKSDFSSLARLSSNVGASVEKESSGLFFSEHGLVPSSQRLDGDKPRPYNVEMKYNWDIKDYIPPVLTEISEDSFTVTQISTFAQCPLKYKYRYLYQLPAEPGLEERSVEFSESVFGTVIHQTLAEYILTKCKWDMDGLMKKFRSLSKAQGVTNIEIKGKEKVAQKILRNFKNNKNNQLKNIIAVEESFTLFIGDCQIKGTIDRIDKMGMNMGTVPCGDSPHIYKIIDYKTGKKEKKDLYFLPMMLYKTGAEKVLGYKPVNELSLYFLQENEFVPVDYNQTIEKETEERVKTIIEKIQREDFDIVGRAGFKGPSSLCNFCEYKLVCEVE
ncbi:ATP-dependent helicase [bacterium]|nr:ATP-dependent helicase [bacterium]